ncbi:hypothetical protein ASQ66_gp16 [Aeropyrum pernix spindle-shaped virus 1]|nr:hypothetical protein ASQ66_gp16 [Aeropyrum pernix spindle-shaped virus 1]CCD22104.1 TPA: hypothetical protein [Aeropyrum pernix spindle-shaped virus 1]
MDGGGSAGSAPSSPGSSRPPDYSLYESQPRPAPASWSPLGVLASALDAPYSFVQERGWGVVERLRRRALREKAEGDYAEGFLWALGASAASFGVGVAAGVTGLFSPRAWREAFHAFMHPGETVRAVASDPLSWPYLAGSVVGPAKLGRAVGRRLGRVREPDLASTSEGSLTLVAAKGERLRWAARLEARGPTVGVKGVKPRPPPDRLVTLETPRGRVELLESRRGSTVRRVYRAEYRDVGKKLLGVEEWSVEGWLRPRYRYRGLLVDPETPGAAVLLEARRPLLRGVDLPPPRLWVEPRLAAPAGAVGLILGLGAAGTGARGGLEGGAAGRPAEAGARGLVSGSSLAGGEAAASTLAGASAASSPAEPSAASAGRGGPEAPPLLGSGSRGRRGRRGKLAYSEILYPGGVLLELL